MADARALLKQQLAKRNSAKKEVSAEPIQPTDEATPDKVQVPSDFYQSKKQSITASHSYAAVIIQAPKDQKEIDFEKEMALFEQEINELTAENEPETPHQPEDEKELHERLFVVDQLKSQIKLSKKIEKLREKRINSNIQKKVALPVKKKKVISPFLEDSD
ncbi:hypothetical protein HDV04_003334 [Boothiomyces sp. JEL0838]|nr:hypothetical protein HDV04_003334 [Boothiomyces sp. JEL0838]